MRILITGATGFLGSHLLRSFVKAGNDVVIIKRKKSDLGRISDMISDVKHYDIESDGLACAFKSGRFDAVVHTAVDYGRQSSDINSLLETNLMFSLRLLEEACRNNSGCFINADSFLNRNVNYYSLTKAQFVEWLYCYRNRIKCINLKIDHMYGPSDDDNKFVYRLINQMLDNVDEINLTPGAQKRDFIYVSDIVDVYQTVLSKIDNFGGYTEFDVGSGTKTTIKTMVTMVYDIVSQLRPVSSKLNFGAVPYRENDKMDFDENIEPLVKLGWSPKVSLSEGLKRTVQELITERIEEQ